MQIYIDTREQLPIEWRNSKRVTLNVGDYTTEQLHNRFHIERKSGQDLYGSIVQGHVRFRNMLIRANIKGIRIVIFVECPRKHFCELKFARGNERKMKPITLERIITTIEERYNIEVVWCKNREHLRKKIYQRLKFEENK